MEARRCTSARGDGGTRFEDNAAGFDGTRVKHRFTGHEKDFAIGIYYANARYYDQRLGRFISCDPAAPDLSDPQSLNPYAYCRNNPVKYVDPEGESATLAGALIGGAIGGLVGLASSVGTELGTWSGGGTFSWSNVGAATGKAAAVGAIGGAAAGVVIDTAGLAGAAAATGWGTALASGYAGAYYESVAGQTVEGMEGGKSIGNALASVDQGEAHNAGAWGAVTAGATKGFGENWLTLSDKPKSPFPDRPLPRDAKGNPIPDSDLPHTQLGTRDGYGQARTWESKPRGGVTATKDIDFTDHGSPSTHPNPHEHKLVPNNPKKAPSGGYGRKKPQPLHDP